MKNTSFQQMLAVTTLAGILATATAFAQAGAGTSGTGAGSGQTPAENSSLNNKAQGSGNNQTKTGGDNAERKSDTGSTTARPAAIRAT